MHNCRFEMIVRTGTCVHFHLIVQPTCRTPRNIEPSPDGLLIMPGVASVPVTRDRRARPAQKGYMRPPPRPKKMTASRKLANLKLRALQDSCM